MQEWSSERIKNETSEWKWRWELNEGVSSESNTKDVSRRSQRITQQQQKVTEIKL